LFSCMEYKILAWAIDAGQDEGRKNYSL